MSVMALEAVKLDLFLNLCIYLFVSFVPLFTLKNERSTVGFSACYDQN